MSAASTALMAAVTASSHHHHHQHHPHHYWRPATGPIAAAALLSTTAASNTTAGAPQHLQHQPQRQRQTSLLTSALGTPIHPFLSANSAAPANTVHATEGDAGQLLQVLDTWDRAWMGSPSQSPGLGVSPAANASTSPSQAYHHALHLRGAAAMASLTAAAAMTAATAMAGSRAAPPSAAAAPLALWPVGVPLPMPLTNRPSGLKGPPSLLSLPIMRSTPVPNLPASPPHPYRLPALVPLPLPGTASAAAVPPASCRPTAASSSPPGAAETLVASLSGASKGCVPRAPVSPAAESPTTGSTGGSLVLLVAHSPDAASSSTLRSDPDSASALVSAGAARHPSVRHGHSHSHPSRATSSGLAILHPAIYPCGAAADFTASSSHEVGLSHTANANADTIPISGTPPCGGVGAAVPLPQAQPADLLNPQNPCGRLAQPPSPPATCTGLPIQLHHPASRCDAQDSVDFASVFFSPLPHSYLNMARSDSADQALPVGSQGSPPDAMLGGGRPASASPHAAGSPGREADLSADVALPASAGKPATARVAAAAAAKAVLSLSASGEGGRLAGHADKAAGSVAAAEQQPREQQQLLQGKSDLAGSATAWPDEHGRAPVEAAGAVSVVARGVSAATAAVASLGSLPASNHGSSSLGSLASDQLHGLSPGSAGVVVVALDTSLLLRPVCSPRSPLAALSPPFFSHSAVASLASMPGMPVVPGADLLPATGYGSIASALEAQKPQARSLRLVAGAAMIPHVDKADKGGEDAYCIVHTHLGAIGVADGVSGWAEEGIDPAEYSRTLIRFCSEALHEAGTSADAREVIRYAHRSTVMPGSSTVCLALMKPTGRLQVANLGDSGVRVIRDGRIVFASAAQQHMFNMPFQLSHPSIIDSPDDADSADVSTVDVLPGDIIVMATDGLYDNVFDDEIAAICYEAMSTRRRSLTLSGSGGDAPPTPEQAAVAAAAADSRLYTAHEAEALALRISRQAHRYAQSPYQRTPWSVASCEQGYSWARYFAKGGGKMDDCTVIVSFVQPDGSMHAKAPA